MSAKIQTLWGYAIPPAPRHAVTVHMPSWETIVRFAERDPALMASFKSMYPRMMPHKDVKEVSSFTLDVPMRGIPVLTGDTAHPSNHQACRG